MQSTLSPPAGNGLSLTRIFDLRGKAFAEISQHSAAIDALAAALADLDAAMQTAIAEHNIDDWQTLIRSARQLSALLDGGAA